MKRDLPPLLITKIKQKDTEAFAELYDRYSGPLYGMVLNIVQNKDIADDVLQESFIKIWNNIARWDEHRSSLFTWMYTIVRNQSLDAWRKENKRFVQPIDSSIERLTGESLDDAQESNEVLSLLTQLDPKYRQVVDYLFIKGMSQREMAEETGIPLGTIKSRLAKAISLLKQRYAEVIIATFILSILTHG